MTSSWRYGGSRSLVTGVDQRLDGSRRVGLQVGAVHRQPELTQVKQLDQRPGRCRALERERQRRSATGRLPKRAPEADNTQARHGHSLLHNRAARKRRRGGPRLRRLALELVDP